MCQTARAKRPAPCEKVGAQRARRSVNRYDSIDDRTRFLRRVACLLFAGRADDGIPPDIRGYFPPCSFFRTDEVRGHVWDTVTGIQIKCVVLRVTGVPEDIVMLWCPFSCWPPTVVVRPNDLVLKAAPPKNLITHHLGIMNLAVIQMQEKAAIWCQ